MWWHSNDRSLQKTNRHRTATPFPKPRRQQIQETPDKPSISSTLEGFAKECNKLRTMFSKLRYPKTLVDSSINKFSQEPDKEIHTVPLADISVYIVLPFKDQRSADRVRKDIYSLGAKIDVNVKPVFTSRKLSQTLSVKENKPPIVNTQCVVNSLM